jgi:hypothetical protein
MRALMRFIRITTAVVICVGINLLVTSIAAAHCDTLDGPVVAAAKMALEKGDVTPVLKWVEKEDEGEVRTAFKKTLAVRAKGMEAKELADMYFFETVVRLHRASEGEPYMGLKPAGTDLGPAIAGADKSLESGSVEGLVKLVTDEVGAGMRERFAHAIQGKKHADESVEAGREFVEAYVEFLHYVERLHSDATSSAGHSDAAKISGAEGRHSH